MFYHLVKEKNVHKNIYVKKTKKYISIYLYICKM